MNRKSRIVLISTLLPVLAGIGLASWFFLLSPQKAAASAGEVTVEIVEVERLVKQEAIEISGNIEPVNSADLAFPIAGYIDAIYVEEGDFVDTGTVLALLEDSQQRYDLAQVEVEIDNENVTGTKRNLDLLELKLEMTQESLDDTRLQSIISGLVASVDAEVGDYVTAQTAGASADVVVRVIDRSEMTAVVEVDELDAPYLSVGQKVEFQFDAYPDLEVFGEVSLVPLEARTTTQGIAVLDTEVTITNPPDEILPYFTFAGEIFLDDQEDLLLIPEETVMSMGTRTMVLKVVSADEAEAAMAGRPGGAATGGQGGSRPEGSGPGAMVVDINLPDGYTAVPVPVEIKSYGNGKYQVISGLELGDRIVLSTAVEAADSDREGAEEEGSANVMEMLGMPSRTGGGDGPPPGQ